MAYVLIQMKVWDMLPFPWAESTVKLLIQDSFQSQHSIILTACFTVDGIILVDNLPPHAVKDPPLSPQRENWPAKGWQTQAQPRKVLGLFW